MKPSDQTTKRPNSWAFPFALCLLGPVFYVTLMFSFLAPLPGIYLHQGLGNQPSGRIWAIFSGIFGTVLCCMVMGPAGLGYIVLAAVPSLVIGEALTRKISPELATLLAVGTICLLSFVGFQLYLQEVNQTPLEFTKAQIEQAATRIKEANYPMGITKEQIELLQEHPEDALRAFPGKFLAVVLILCAIPTILLLRWNPKNLRRRLNLPRNYIRLWRLPDQLIWVTLAVFAFRVFEVPYLSVIALNLIEFLMVLYFLQGISILAYFLDLFRSRGPMRTVFYGIAVLLYPMVISFGFSDLWFNFRSRFSDRGDKER